MKRVLCSTLLVVCCCQLQAAELYVRPGDYSSIQAAINDANHGDMVIVDPCTYYENINFKGKAITLTSLDPNDPCVVAATVIDGSTSIDPNVGSVVTFNSGEGNDSVLTGFTITGGNGSWLTTSWLYYGKRWNRCGGGVLCCNMSAPTITKNTFTGNVTDQGAGVYVYGNPVNPNNPSNPPVHLQPIITYNTFVDNDANTGLGFVPPNSDYPFEDHGDGGAIVCFQGVDAQIIGNIIKNNFARNYGGGIHIRQWSDGTITQNYIADNNAHLGGGIHITYQSDPTVSRNEVLRNYATNWGGGGIYVYYESRPVIDRNLIAENESTNGAGMFMGWSSYPVIINNLIVGNIGRGIAVRGTSNPTIINNTICQNTAGGIGFYDNSVSTIANNIIGISDSGYGLLAQTGSTPQIHFNNVWANPSGNYNAVIGDLTGTNGNISTDPCFATLGYWSDNNTPADANDDFFVPGNYHLVPDSYCSDAGDNSSVPAESTVDIDDEARVFNGSVDMGADEIVTNPYDLNTDGIVDYAELKTFTDEWLQTGSSLQTDFYDDDSIDFLDFALLAQQWLWTGPWRQ